MTRIGILIGELSTEFRLVSPPLSEGRTAMTSRASGEAARVDRQTIDMGRRSSDWKKKRWCKRSLACCPGHLISPWLLTCRPSLAHAARIVISIRDQRLLLSYVSSLPYLCHSPLESWTQSSSLTFRLWLLSLLHTGAPLHILWQKTKIVRPGERAAEQTTRREMNGTRRSSGMGG